MPLLGVKIIKKQTYVRIFVADKLVLPIFVCNNKFTATAKERER